MSIEHLSWDSDFFGRSIGRWRTPNIQADNLPDPVGFELIYVEVQETPEPTLKAEGWHDAGRKLTFTGPTSSAPVDDAIRTLTHRNTELEELAWLSGHQSRYKLDPRFTDAEFKRLYTRWIDACLEGQWNARILGLESNAQLAGFVTVESMEDHARIGLIAVHPNHQGQGLSGRLIAAARSTAKVQGHSELKVSTQGSNEAAINAYIHRGFKKMNSTHYYHWWVEQ